VQLYSLNLKQGQNFILLTKMLTIGAKLARLMFIFYFFIFSKTKRGFHFVLPM